MKYRVRGETTRGMLFDCPFTADDKTEVRELMESQKWVHWWEFVTKKERG